MNSKIVSKKTINTFMWSLFAPLLFLFFFSYLEFGNTKMGDKQI